MLFEEFFKKKKIDLPVLEKAEPSLFSEFKTHYNQMGEKSFDHSKKYWFNKLRRQFPLAPEIKTEKPHIANPIAEQTVTESLIEAVSPPPSPKTGFTPRFKAGATTKPVEAIEDKKEDATIADEVVNTEPSTLSPKVGFTPRFKAGVTSKPVEAADDKKEDNDAFINQQPSETPSPSPKVGFTPRFKAGVTSNPTPTVEDKKEEVLPAGDNAIKEEPAAPTSPKVGFTPRFKAANMPKPAVEPITDKKEEVLPAGDNIIKEQTPDNTTAVPAPKVGFTPRFKAGTTPKQVANTDGILPSDSNVEEE